MPISSVAAFIETVSRHGLLEQPQLEELTRVLATKLPDLQGLARELWHRGWLTKYQIEQILKGQAQELVLDQYILLEPLGEGGMGQVFKARQHRLDRLVALKIIHKERLANPDATRRFYREIQVAAQLSHPNIVLAYDADQVGDKNFFAMEYLEGIDLAKLIKQSGPLPIAQACDFIRQAALGLQHAYECGMVHRDIKPSNLMITYARVKTGGGDSGKDLHGEAAAPAPAKPPSNTTRVPIVKVLDMGLARFKSATDAGETSTTLTKEGYVLGTLDYIAPEQATDPHQVDIRADLYSLGCTLFFVLTGQPPFAGGNPMEKLFRHQMEKPPALDQLRPDAPPGLAAVVGRLLAKRPQERYQTPAQLATALTVVLSGVGSGVGARQSGTHAVQTLPPDPTVALPGVGGAPPPTTTAEETVESATSWSKIISVSGPAAVPMRRKKDGKSNPQLFWMIGAGAGLVVASILMLIFVLTRKDKPTQPPDQTAQALGKASKKLSGKASRLPSESEKRPPVIVLKVDATKPWQDTGVEIKIGEPITTEARGEWQKGQVSCPANGLPAEPRERTELLDAPAMCLLGRVGDETTPIFLGAGKTFTPTQEGRLFVQANSLDLEGNLGALDVRIQGGTRSEIPAAPRKPTSAEAADAARKALQARSNLGALREGYLDLRLRYPGTPQAEHAAEILRQYPSFLDKLTTELIPAEERFSWQPQELVAAFGEHRQRHWGPVYAVAISPDRKVIASAGDDALIRLWNPYTGKEEGTLRGHSGPVYALEFAPDGKTLVSASVGPPKQPSEIKVWDATTWEVSENRPGYANAIPFSDGKTVSTRGDDGIVKLWDIATGKELATLKGHSGAVSAVALTADRKTVATASADNTVKTWDAITGKERVTCTGHNQPVHLVAFAPDGRTVASAGADQKSGSGMSPRVKNKPAMPATRMGPARWHFPPMERL